MLNYQCKCGNAQGLGSMPFAPCEGCPECGTRIMPVGTREYPNVAPHSYTTTQRETDEGLKPLTRCRNCLKTKRELEQMEAALRAPGEVAE